MVVGRRSSVPIILNSSWQGVYQNQGNQGEIREISVGFKISGESQGIRLTLENIRELSWKLFVSASLINRFPNMLKY